MKSQKESTRIIDALELQMHPEGGFYKETYRSKGYIPNAALPDSVVGDRNYSTAIYYLLEDADFSAFHRIKSDEMWHFYSGETLLIHEINVNGEYICHQLGSQFDKGDQFQLVIPTGSWFASQLETKKGYALVGCTVSPGFDFDDFEIANQIDLLALFPHFEPIIKALTR